MQISDVDAYFHHMGTPRGMVEGASFASTLVVPRDRALKAGGTVLQAEVLSIGPTSAVIKRPGAVGSETITFDYGVVALGMSYPKVRQRAWCCKHEDGSPAATRMCEPRATDATSAADATPQLPRHALLPPLPQPIKVVSGHAADTVAAQEAVAQALARASSVIIVGGGPVGCETAAELRVKLPATTTVTVLHSGPHLLSGARNRSRAAPKDYPAAMHERVAAKLKEAGVAVVLNERVVGGLPAEGGAFGKDSVLLTPSTLTGASGATYTADVVILAAGGRPNSAPVAAGLPAAVDAAGFVKVTPTLNVEGHPTLFALGDVAATGDAKTGVNAMGQAGHVVRALRAATSGKAVPLYPGAKSHLMVITLGPRRGVGSLGGFMVGDRVVSMVKGKDFFAGMARKLLNATGPAPAKQA
jgi:NADPH-dependent 2,4-dienoyl-CoA reductase/sulfur reductase-like enzyme